MLFLGSSSTYSPLINHSGKIVPLRFFFEPQYFGSDLRLARTKTAISIRSVQNADCRPGTKCRLRIYSFFLVWYVITCHLTTYWASRNRFSAIIFHNYLHYCGIFLARFLITIVLNIVSSLHKVFSLCARADWCDVWIEFTNLIIKVDVDVNEMPLSNIFKTRAIFEKKLTALHVVHSFYLFNRYVFTLLTKLRTETKTVPFTWYILNVQGCTHTDFHICALYCYIVKGKAKRFFRDWPFVYVTGGFISHQFGDYANINLWKSDNM